MDRASKLVLSRFMTVENFDPEEVLNEVKNEIRARLQSCANPTEAFLLKLELDAADAFFLRLKQLARDVNPSNESI